MTENIFGENKEEENPMNALRGFRIGDIVEHDEMVWQITRVHSTCTLSLKTSTMKRRSVNPKDITRNLSRGD